MSHLTFTQILRNRKLYNEAVLRRREIAVAGCSYVEPKPMLDQSDDDYDFVNDSLQRWADRRFQH